MGFRLTDSRLLNLKKFIFISGYPIRPHPTVPVVDVGWLNEVINNRPDLLFTDALTSLEKRLFPKNYNPCEWVEGKMSF